MAAPKPAALPFFGTLVNWAQSTFYAANERVLANGNVYTNTTAGTSSNAGAGPAGNGAGIADGTCSWNFVVAASAAWLATHAYALGDAVTNGGNLYSCIQAGTSAGSGGPSGTGGAIVDGGVVWTYVSAITAKQTAPTSRVADLGASDGSPFFAGYLNYILGSRDPGIFGWLRWLNDFENAAHTWTGTQTFSDAPTTWFAVQSFASGGTKPCTMYMGPNGRWCIALNATFTDATGKWHQPVNATSYQLLFDPSIGLNLYLQPGPTADWNDGYGAGAWNGGFIQIDQGTVAGSGSVQFTGNIVSTAGSATINQNISSVAGSVTAQVNVTATTGNVTAGASVSAGTGISTSTGNVTATAGDHIGQHFIDNQSVAPTAVAGLGQGNPSVNVDVTVNGTDTDGVITVVASAGVAAGDVATITFNKSYGNGNAPRVVLYPTNAATAGLANQPYVTPIGPAWTGFKFTTIAAAPLVSGTTYQWNYHVLG